MTSGDRDGVSLWPCADSLGTVTDLYQLTMMAGYHVSGMSRCRAVFELFVRKLPPHRSFLVFAGLEQAIQDLDRLAFSPAQVEYIRGLPSFAHVAPDWFDELARTRFTGNVWAIPEGTVVFPNEPLVRVEAPLPEAQWVETFLIASLAYPTIVASKAVRCVQAAAGRPLLDFGTRRGHGPHSGFLCARSAYLAGFSGTSHVEAARLLGIPCVGTMAHSWVQSFTHEIDAFQVFARVFPTNATLLVDTYDTAHGVQLAADTRPPAQAIRIDSGDLAELTSEARRILDDRGRQDVKILLSGDLNEYKIESMLRQGTPADAFAVGTELITSADAPSLPMVYKLVELDGVGRLKLSSQKRSYPFAKQVERLSDPDNRFVKDRIVLDQEPPAGPRLLELVMSAGRRVAPAPSLDQIREHCRRQIASLPEPLLALDSLARYPVEISDSLEQAASSCASVAR